MNVEIPDRLNNGENLYCETMGDGFVLYERLTTQGVKVIPVTYKNHKQIVSAIQGNLFRIMILNLVCRILGLA